MFLKQRILKTGIILLALTLSAAACLGQAQQFGAIRVNDFYSQSSTANFEVDAVNTTGGRFIVTTGGTVGIGIPNPNSSYKLHVNGGVRVQTNYSMGGAGTFQIDAPDVVGGRLSVASNGNVGIGTGATVPTYAKVTLFNIGAQLGFCHTDGDIKLGTSVFEGSAKFGTSTNHGLNFMTNNSTQMTITTDGKVGIGIIPTEKLTVSSPVNTIGFCNTDGVVKLTTGIIQNSAGIVSGAIGTVTNHSLKFTVNNNNQMIINTDGNVGIGTTTPGTYKLAVEGTIGARAIQVKATSWADFVFDKDYKLKPLKEVEDFIRANKRLPGVPSEDQVKKDGVNLGDMTTTLLQKIEELTLYAIEQNKRMDEQNKRIEAIEKENTSLKEKLNRQ